MKSINDVCNNSKIFIHVWERFISHRFVTISKDLFDSGATYFNELHCCSHSMLYIQVSQ